MPRKPKKPEPPVTRRECKLILAALEFAREDVGRFNEYERDMVSYAETKTGQPIGHRDYTDDELEAAIAKVKGIWWHTPPDAT